MSVEHNENGQSKTLDGRTFKLDPSQLITPPTSSVKRIFYMLLLIVTLPILIAVLLALTTVMFLGPTFLSKKIISKFIPKAMSRLAAQFSSVRRTLLPPEMLSNCKVLDLGSGGGAYMSLLSTASEIIALEPVKDMHPTIQKVAREEGISGDRLKIYDYGIEEYIQLNPDQVNTFDWVILGNVLCEVPSQVSTLKSVDCLLKVGGRVYFSEHVGYVKGTWMRFMQDTLNPWWKVISGGCNCNRDTHEEIHKMLNWDIISWNYSSEGKGPPLIGPFHVGLAVKTCKGKSE